jgi:hypothetical protein
MRLKRMAGVDSSLLQPRPGRALLGADVVIRPRLRRLPNVFSKPVPRKGRPRATKWEMDGCSYSGMVEGRSAAGAWSILADNCSCAPVVSRRDISRCKSRKGDQMLINRDKCATVTKVFVTSRLVHVEVEKREELGFIRWKMAEVHVPKHAVLAGWRDRMVYTPSIVPARQHAALGHGGSPSKLVCCIRVGVGTAAEAAPQHDSTERAAVTKQIRQRRARAQQLGHAAHRTVASAARASAVLFAARACGLLHCLSSNACSCCQTRRRRSCGSSWRSRSACHASLCSGCRTATRYV